jgi:putative cardiolipin synthase
MRTWMPAALMAAAITWGCAGLPQDVARPASAPITGSTDTALDRTVAAATAAHPGLAGVHPLPDGHGAFAARMLAARSAARSLDVQVYIWRGDATGTLLFEETRRAADRGVRVRLLIDDNGTAGLDPVLAMLDAHPSIEVRLFNPFAQRGALRVLGFATEFTRLNRRMHNKSFTVDQRLTIVGGRNIGDEYFSAGDEPSFADLDLIVIGDAVREVSDTFERYWSDAAAYPVAALLAGAAPMPADAWAGRLEEIAADPATAVYRRAVATSSLVRDLLAGTLPSEWASARLFADDPAKIREPMGTRAVQMFPKLVAELGTPRRGLDLVSPYFVPGEAGTEALATLAAGGVRVRVLTNSLAATDVAAVHAGYAKRREALLRSGVELLELRPRFAGRPRDDGAGVTGSSRASLHAKTFSVDGERIFVGSFNFDQRSAELNTEMGFVVDSPPLAMRLSTAFDTMYPSVAYRVVLDAEGRLRWLDGGAEPLRSEPGVGLMRRALVRVLSWLPIEWML